MQLGVKRLCSCFISLYREQRMFVEPWLRSGVKPDDRRLANLANAITLQCKKHWLLVWRNVNIDSAVVLGTLSQHQRCHRLMN